jgi:hypothetical protein
MTVSTVALIRATFLFVLLEVVLKRAIFLLVPNHCSYCSEECSNFSALPVVLSESHRFGLHIIPLILILMMEAEIFLKALLSAISNTLCHKPEDHIVSAHCHKNPLNLCIRFIVFFIKRISTHEQ